MEIAWLYLLYIVIALLGVAAALFLWRAFSQPPAREHIGAWISIVIGVCFFVIYATKFGRDLVVLVLGLFCTLAGFHSLETSRLNARIARLEQQVGGSGGSQADQSPAP
jgi:hypothetical protein